ncbi:MAG: hypothetical protein QF819_05740 [Gemmatimonadota bacterium]|nr:hypothetical protein [Gemmatimonadota bacterium]MDP6529391.1 hypothetical protein [Gemmatimonadota bacterium]MDP6802664.1 hypothetical protein [Gemmatimonadota bacterium]MDP7031663.1 hypothetical protein [Gemmatimonadota bacterium]
MDEVRSPRRILEDEGRTLGRYILGEGPAMFILEKYVQAHAAGVVEPPGGADSFDRLVVEVAQGGHGLTRFADSYCALFRRGGLLRRKLSLLVALLESVAPTDAAVDRVTAPGRTRTFLDAAFRAAAFAVLAAFSIPVFGPAHLALRRRSGGRA